MIHKWTDGHYNELVLSDTELSGMIGNYREGGGFDHIKIQDISEEKLDNLLVHWDCRSKISKAQVKIEILELARSPAARTPE